MKKVRIKTAKKQLGDKTVITMFNQMVGAEGADSTILLPKYNNVKAKIKLFAKILSSMADDVISKTFTSQQKGCSEINEYAKQVANMDLPTFEEKNLKDSEACKLLNTTYIQLKEHKSVQLIIISCKNLLEYSKYFEADSDYDDSFIARIPGFKFSPFPFSCLNFKEMWYERDIDEKIKKYIFTCLRLCCNYSHDIYKTITSPDVDAKEFSRIIVASIAQVKKQVPRCEKAFNRIEQSVNLLEGNFDGYYKDFVQSKNPSTIIESFVIDVSRQGSSDAQTTGQFRKIIAYYQKATQGKIKDPKIKKVFDMLTSNFKIMEEDSEKTMRGNVASTMNKDIPVDDVQLPKKEKKTLTKNQKRRIKNKKEKEVSV
jgi:hypothetical protein